MRIAALITLLVLSALAGTAGADDQSAACIRIDRVTAFAPRGEVYVEVAAECAPRDFGSDDSVLAYLEVLAGQALPLGEDVRVYATEPKLRRTFHFDTLALQAGDVLLVRLVRFGEIVDLETIKVP